MPKISDLGIPGAPPQMGENKHARDRYVVFMQNFTPIGATIAEISVTGQRKNRNQYSLPYSATLRMD